MIATSPSRDPAGDDHVEHGLLQLLDGRERDPLAFDQRDAHAADRAENGRPEIWVDADAALIASTSYRSAGSRLRIVTTTWISLRSPR